MFPITKSSGCLIVGISLIVLASVAEGKKQWSHPMHHVYSDQPEDVQYTPAEGHQGKFLSLTMDDLQRMKRALRKIPYHGSPLEVVYNVAKMAEEGYDIDISMDDLMPDSAHVMLDMWENNEDFRNELTDYLNNPPPSAQDIVVLNDEDTPAPEDRAQTQGVEGCVADYDAYTGPLTQRWIWDALRVNFPNFGRLGSRPEGPHSNYSMLLDASGRRPSGLFEGTNHWLGVLEECMSVTIEHTVPVNGMNETRLFKGRYARLDMPLQIDLGNSTLTLPFALGVCVPDTCTEEYVREYLTGNTTCMGDTIMCAYNPLTSILFSSNISTLEDVYMQQDIDWDTDIPAKAAFGILLGGLIIIVISTCYDGFGRHRIIRKNLRKRTIGKDDKKLLTNEDLRSSKSYLYEEPGIKDKLEVAWSAYSLYTSFQNTFSARPRYPNYHVPALDGIRSITILWIIYGMSYVYGVVYFECPTNSNLISAAQHFIGEFRFMPVISSYYANTSLFFISGFVCVQMWFRHYNKSDNQVSVGMVIKWILGRYLAIMPAMMFLLMIYTCLAQYITDGPMQPRVVTDATNCRETWWVTMLLFHNLFKTEKQCMAWTWMYGAVWQLNLASVFILIPLVILPAVGYVLIGIMYLAYIVILPIWSQQSLVGDKSYYWDILQTPWCNAGPYCIGMILAIIMKKGHKKTPKMNIGLVLLLWIISLTMIAIVVYAPYDTLKENGRDWTDAGNVAYDTMAPQMLSLCLAWVTWACYYGYGGVIGDLLNWRFFTVTGKLAMPMTLFMGPTMMSYFYARVDIFYVHESTMGYVHHGHIVGVFIFGVIVAVLFHNPISRSLKIQVVAETRLELLLHCRHPKILDQLLGDEHEDEHFWDKLENQAKQEKQQPSMSSANIVFKKGKPIGGFIPCQDPVSDAPDFAPPAYQAFANGVKPADHHDKINETRATAKVSPAGNGQPGYESLAPEVKRDDPPYEQLDVSSGDKLSESSSHENHGYVEDDVTSF